MCYNCGCGMPDDDHGNSDNITTATFEKAAKAANQSVSDAKKNTDKLIDKEM